jgi:hypothetical protein
MAIELCVSNPSAAEAHDAIEDAERYRLVSIEAARAPDGCAGRDWFVYRILQGVNAITGYRQGSRAQVSSEVETILAGLNGRRRWSSSKPTSRSRRGAGRPKTAAAASGSESHSTDAPQ